MSRMELAENYYPGLQIAYIPDHANGDIKHKDVEFGFVTNTSAERPVALCRYWNKSYPEELRTKANGEWTPYDNLTPHDFKEQAIVDELLKKIQDGIPL